MIAANRTIINRIAIAGVVSGGMAASLEGRPKTRCDVPSIYRKTLCSRGWRIVIQVTLAPSSGRSNDSNTLQFGIIRTMAAPILHGRNDINIDAKGMP